MLKSLFFQFEYYAGLIQSYCNYSDYLKKQGWSDRGYRAFLLQYSILIAKTSKTARFACFNIIKYLQLTHQ
jgi:hypothetical protein